MKTSVVTGGASGIGLELSKLLIKDNYKVFIIDNNSKNSNVIESKKFVKLNPHWKLSIQYHKVLGIP